MFFSKKNTVSSSSESKDADKKASLDVMQKIRDKLIEDDNKNKKTTSDSSSMDEDFLNSALLEEDAQSDKEDDNNSANKKEDGNKVLEDINKVYREAIDKNETEKKNVEKDIDDSDLLDTLMQEGEERNEKPAVEKNDNNAFVEEQAESKDSSAFDDDLLDDALDESVVTDVADENQPGRDKVVENNASEVKQENKTNDNVQHGVNKNTDTNNNADDNIVGNIMNVRNDTADNVDDAILDDKNNNDIVKNDNINSYAGHDVHNEKVDAKRQDIGNDRITYNGQKPVVLNNFNPNSSGSSYQGGNYYGGNNVEFGFENSANGQNRTATNQYKRSTFDNSEEHYNLSNQTKSNVKGSITELIENVKNQMLLNRYQGRKISNEPRTMEQFVADLVQPKIIEYLDANLDQIVRDVVNNEIKKIVDSVGNKTNG